jgi:hypothetical protein
VKEINRTEEQQKDMIFDTFSKCRSETEPARLQVYYLKLCVEVYSWYKDYLSKNVDKMGLEIAKVISQFIKDKTIQKIPQDKDGFFKYLNTSINREREKEGSFRQYSEKVHIKISKEQKLKLRKVEDFRRMKERELGRELTNDELMQGVTKWFKKQEYINLANLMNLIITPELYNEGKNKIDLFDEYIKKMEMKIYQEAVNSILKKKQKNSRDCCKALFTLYCVENDLMGLYPILDQEIIDACHKYDKKIYQYEIYRKYHPNIKKKSAEAMASSNLKAFLKEINTYLKQSLKFS